MQLRHPVNDKNKPICKRENSCWKDADGVEYHAGNSYGIYVVFPGAEKATFFDGRDLQKIECEADTVLRRDLTVG